MRFNKSFAYIKKSIELATNGEADAVATTPINKEALRAAEILFLEENLSKVFRHRAKHHLHNSFRRSDVVG